MDNNWPTFVQLPPSSRLSVSVERLGIERKRSGYARGSFFPFSCVGTPGRYVPKRRGLNSVLWTASRPEEAGKWGFGEDSATERNVLSIVDSWLSTRRADGLAIECT